MSELKFTSSGETLSVNVKPNQIEWGYTLNTSVTPTYGGEVIQILSAKIDEMTIIGEVKSYAKAEEIYSWFIKRLQKSTQDGGFDQRGINMYYPERGWSFKIAPMSMTPLEYGRDIVVPQWGLTANVIQPDQNVVSKIMDQATVQAMENKSGVPIFGRATGEIGWVELDPFRTHIDPKDMRDVHKRLLNGEVDRYDYRDIGDWFNRLIPSYLEGSYDDLLADYSRPAFQEQSPKQNERPGHNKREANRRKRQKRGMDER